MAEKQSKQIPSTVLVNGTHIRVCRNSWTGRDEPCRLWCSHLDHNSGRCLLSLEPPSEWERKVSRCIQVPLDCAQDFITREDD